MTTLKESSHDTPRIHFGGVRSKIDHVDGKPGILGFLKKFVRIDRENVFEGETFSLFKKTLQAKTCLDIRSFHASRIIPIANFLSDLVRIYPGFRKNHSRDRQSRIKLVLPDPFALATTTINGRSSISPMIKHQTSNPRSSCEFPGEGASPSFLFHSDTSPQRTT